MNLTPGREPVLYGVGLITLGEAGLATATSYGVVITPELHIFVSLLIPIVVGLVVRQFTTPSDQPVVQDGTVVTVTPPPAIQRAVVMIARTPYLQPSPQGNPGGYVPFNTKAAMENLPPPNPIPVTAEMPPGTIRNIPG